MTESDNTGQNIGTTWKGFAAIKHLVIFGDSYSDVGYTMSHKTCHPTKEEPLGVEYPGSTYAEWGKPNWVGYLVKQFSSGQDTILVYDYAIGGQLVNGVINQIDKFFLPFAGNKPDWAPWTESDALFVTWIGINDCAYTFENYTEYQGPLFKAQSRLYDKGARNFLFIDIPPIEKSPAVMFSSPELKHRYEQWNQALRENVSSFVSAHSGVTAFVFSSYALFSRMLDNPTDFGFPKGDAKKRGGTMWVDHLHPTSAVHKEVAGALSQFLTSQPAHSGQAT